MQIAPPNRWTIDQSQMVTSTRRYKHSRINTQPNMSIYDSDKGDHLVKPPFLHKLQYNKWYIKPQDRLKERLNHTASSVLDQFNENYFYEHLYKGGQQSKTPLISKLIKDRNTFAEKVCSNSQNVRLLSTFKNRKQQQSKRVPAIIDYLIDFHSIKEKEHKSTLPKKKTRLF